MDNLAFVTLIVPANLVTLARGLAGALSPGGVGMFTAQLSASGSAPATHFVSTGYIDEGISGYLADASKLHEACVAAGANVSLAQCQALVTQSDVTSENPFSVFSRLGLKLVNDNL